MPIVAAVRLRYVPKDYWFDPNGIDFAAGDHVVVGTERGREVGLCVGTGIEVRKKDLKSPLKPVLRKATQEDFERIDELSEQAEHAMRRFRELVRLLSSELHIRVDMRQIGVRDEARAIGGLGHCGQELCCVPIGVSMSALRLGERLLKSLYASYS